MPQWFSDRLLRALAETEIWKFGRAYNMPCEPVDGMDVFAVEDATKRASIAVRAETSAMRMGLPTL